MVHHSTPKGPKASKIKAVDLVTGKEKTEYFFDPTLALAPDSLSNDTSFKGVATPAGKSAGLRREDSSVDDSILYYSRHLFLPCSIVKMLDEPTAKKETASTETWEPTAQGPGDKEIPALVKTSDGTLHKIRDVSKLIRLVSPDDYVGVDDILHLQSVTEPSLLHTLRTRYKRDDIYTNAGPILISINPYKNVTSTSTHGALSTPSTSIANADHSIYSIDHMMQYRNASVTLGGASAAQTLNLPPHLFGVADRVYTALLSSVDPLQGQSHLNEDALMVFRGNNLETDSTMTPSTISPKNQSIIISGESGAGKTEATKYIMQYLARITRKSLAVLRQNTVSPTAPPFSPSPERIGRNGHILPTLEDRVLSSNPLLESFGNARTLRNDNSSRFGKFIQIIFNTKTGAIVGASIFNYLLEKTRITTQMDGERNYHIFYQLLSGADEATLAEWKLSDGAASFRYLGNRSSAKSRRDVAGWTETKECLDRIGLDEEEQKNIFQMVAAVLHVGNIDFGTQADGRNDSLVNDESNDDAKIDDVSMSSLVTACTMLGLKVEDVKEAILTKSFIIGGKTIKKPQNLVQAADKRDAFAKMVYSSLFVWLVHKVNQTIACESAGLKSNNTLVPVDLFSSPVGRNRDFQTGFIGLLDIYGFEQFETNGFEQLLINYANEKLQRHFNRHLFEVEQALYAAEGVDWTYITFNDNKPCLDLIEGGSGTVGILSTLDDAWSGMGSSSEKDVKFVSQLHQLFGDFQETSTTSSVKKSKKAGSHPNFKTPKFGNDRQFIIVHYAGEVRYTANSFVEKNVESLSNELKDLGLFSSITMVREIFSLNLQDEDTAGDNRRSTIRGISVASQFRLSLQDLVAELEQTQPHYIRCIKPNLNKAPNAFDGGEVLRQLRYAGMMEAIRIRREGYALRELHESFYSRFNVLLSSTEKNNGEGIQALVRVLSKRLNLTISDCQIGHTKIFLRHELASKLERLLLLRNLSAARTIGRFGRFIAHRRASNILTSWAKFRVHCLRKYYARKAAIKMISFVRMSQQKVRFKEKKNLAIRIQSYQRRRMAVAYVKRLRDPYGHLTYVQLNTVYEDECKRLESAVASKDFKVAVELEHAVETLKSLIELKRPMTRQLLETKILEVQRSLDDAVARKAYVECSSLQHTMDQLVSRRADFPTVDERREKITKIESALAEAVNRRDFTAASDLQFLLDEERNHLDSELLTTDSAILEKKDTIDSNGSSGDNSFKTRAQLEDEISKLKTAVEQAISSKDFKKAETMQNKVDIFESLRPQYPTLGEMESLLKSKRSKMAEALKNKKFADAETLDKEIENLQLRVDKEREDQITHEIGNHGYTKEDDQAKERAITLVNGVVIEVSSRFQLDKEIAVYSELTNAAVHKKQFNEAKQLRSVVDQLESFRVEFPHIDELKKRLAIEQHAFQDAVDKHDFVLAEQIDSRITSLTEKINIEQGENHKHAPSSPSSKVSSAIPMTMLKEERNGQHQSRKRKTEHAVSRLRPSKPVFARDNDTVLTVTQTLSVKRCDASVITNSTGRLVGIITDTDITRRVVAKSLDPSSTLASSVMTANPTVVLMSDSAMDALSTMVENHFRHLPVVDDTGNVVGLLDIAKCLNSAISKLEKASEKSASAAQDAVQQMASLQGVGGAQAAMIKQLLGPLIAQAFGGQTSPTLRSLLASKPVTIVSPNTTIRKTGMVMAEARKAALIVENGKLAGIFTFKDMLSRVVAKELHIDSATISTVMTSNPEYVSPEITVVEALQIMHDNKFLNLPVCEDNGVVVGLVDVMDLIYGCGGSEGWRSVFHSAMDAEDDDLSASESAPSKRTKSQGSVGGKRSVKAQNEEHPVSRLRPSKPVFARDNDTVLTVTQTLSVKRCDASVITNSTGRLVGIITDTDITRRVVAKSLDPSSTLASSVMTANPTVVSMSDSAMDALSTMVENHFRHLPVVDDTGNVVGLLDIAKCLNSAISKLEKASEKSASAAQDAVQQMASLQGVGGAQAAMIKQLLGPLIAQAFGGQTSPTLRSLLASKPVTIVSPNTTIRKTGMVMAEARKAALIVENGKLAGIFTFKDMLSRVVAKELHIDSATISTAMTSNPEYVSPEITVVEALQIMHDNKFLNLPVCEDNGVVVGLVDVMDLIYGCGGSEGWRSVFHSAMDAEDDDLSASESAPSKRTKSQGSVGGKRSVKAQNEEHPVSRLRPSKPVFACDNDTVLTVTQTLSVKRCDASVITNSTGRLVGIITDTDITRRVVAKSLDPSSTLASSVMTANPTVVSMSDSAMDALSTMVENHFRHLPVVDDTGNVVGLLDIAKCLNSAISKLEKASEKSASAAQDAVQQMASLQGVGGAQAAMIKQLLGPLIAQAFGGQTSPTLRSLLASKPVTIVSPNTTIRKTGMVMAEARKAALIVENGKLAGIFTFKDMLSRVVAKELHIDSATISTVMTPNPEYVSPEITVVEALQIMHDNKFLNLPVCEDNGVVVGLVDVMDLIYGCGGSEGWRSVFRSAIASDYRSDASLGSAEIVSANVKSVEVGKAHITDVVHVGPGTLFARPAGQNVPSQVEFDDDILSLRESISDSFLESKNSSPMVFDRNNKQSVHQLATFKVSFDERIYRIRCATTLNCLFTEIVEKIGGSIKSSNIQLKFVDNEGDEIIVSSDNCLQEAVSLSKKSGAEAVRLLLTIERNKKENTSNDKILIMAGVAAVALVIVLALKPKK